MQSACPRHPKSGLRSGGRLRRRQEDRQNPLQPGEVGVNFKTGIDRRAFHHYQPDRHVREIAECGGSHSAGSRKEREQEKAGNSLPEPEKRVQLVAETRQEEPEGETPPTDVQTTTQDVQAQVQPETSAEPGHCRWSIGLNAGIPFFWGDMLSMSADKTYIGFAAGVQGGYRLSDLLAVSLSVDYTCGKLGARGYAQDYLLAPDGMTWYVPQQQGMQRYGDLYSKVSLVNMGLSFDVNLNRIFSRQAAEHRFTVWVSPAVYGQFFKADVYTKADDKRYSDGTTVPDGLSLGLGGALTLRCRVGRGIDLQLKNTVLWMADNHFEAIRTPFGKTRHNAMWLPQIGVVWHIK